MYDWTCFASAWLLSFSLAAQLCIHVIIEHYYCCESVSFLQSVLVMTQVTLASIEHSKPQKLNCWKRRKISMHERWFTKTNFSGASLHKYDQQSESSHWSGAWGCHRCLQVSTSVIQFCQNFVQSKLYNLSQFPSCLIKYNCPQELWNWAQRGNYSPKGKEMRCLRLSQRRTQRRHSRSLCVRIYTYRAKNRTTYFQDLHKAMKMLGLNPTEQEVMYLLFYF